MTCLHSLSLLLSRGLTVRLDPGTPVMVTLYTDHGPRMFPGRDPEDALFRAEAATRGTPTVEVDS